MSTIAPAIVNFTAGELSPHIDGRVDLAKYQNGCRMLENFVPLVTGGLMKRSGTRYIASGKTSATAFRLVEFAFSIQQNYILEFGNLYMRVYMNGGIVLSGGVPYELVTPYLAADLPSLFFAQSADVLYVAHPNYAPRKILRSGHASWAINTISFSPPPFTPENTDQSIRLFISASTGNGITLKSNVALFSAADVGSSIRLREIPEAMHRPWQPSDVAPGAVGASGTQFVNAGNVYRAVSGAGGLGLSPPTHNVLTERESDGNYIFELDHFGYGYVTITAFVSTTQVTVNVINRVPECYVGTADNDPGAYTHFERYRWSWGAFDAISLYPRTVAFFEDRLWWAGTNGDPQTMWGSRTGDYENHRVDATDESAVAFTINQGLVDQIHWLVPWRQLTIGTSGSEIVAGAINPDQAITPTNPPNLNRNKTTYGSRDGVAPVQVDNALLFVQRGGQKLREVMFDFNSDTYIASDMMLLADHIALGRISQMAYQQEPNRTLWCTTDSGELIALTYERQQQVVGWHRHVLGGTDVFVESVAVLHGTLTDEVWLAVRRTVNGATARFIERIDPDWQRDADLGEAFFVDAGLTYFGAPKDEIGGLEHLEGETVAVLADGAHHPDRTVTAGKILLQADASQVHVGLRYTAKLKTMRLEGGRPDGTGQTRLKQINEVAFRLDQTGAGLFYGGTEDLMDQVYFRSTVDDTGEPVPLFGGDTDRYIWPTGYETDGYLILHHRLPLPCTIVGIFPILAVQER